MYENEFRGIAVGALTMQDAAAATGNGVAMDVHGMVVCGMQVSGTFSGTITFEGSIDGTNYVAMLAANPVSGATSTTITAAGVRVVYIDGLYHFVRARVSAWVSGNITVIGRAAAISSGIVLT